MLLRNYALRIFQIIPNVLLVAYTNLLPYDPLTCSSSLKFKMFLISINDLKQISERNKILSVSSDITPF